MSAAPCERLAWDSEFFGCAIARVIIRDGVKPCFEAVLDWCENETIACAYLLTPASDIETIRAAEDRGFRLTDIRVTLGRKIADYVPADVDVRAALREDVRALAALARISHTDSRFYADVRFPRRRCDDLYAVWIEKSCNGYAQAVFVVEYEGKPAGYVTCHHDGQTGNIGLIAVDPSAQGRGYGTKLVNAAVGFFQEQGAEGVTVVTQGRNLAALRMYERSGFTARSVEVWHHRWFRDAGRVG